MLERGRQAELADGDRETEGENEREGGACARLRLEHSRLLLRDLNTDHSIHFHQMEKKHSFLVGCFD